MKITTKGFDKALKSLDNFERNMVNILGTLTCDVDYIQAKIEKFISVYGTDFSEDFTDQEFQFF